MLTARFFKIGFWLLAILLVTCFVVAFIATQGQIGDVFYCLKTIIGGI